MAMDWSFLGGYDQNGQYKMNPEFLKMLANIGNKSANGASVGQMLGGAAGDVVTMRTLMGQNPQLSPTPKGQAGPDSITTKQTADGTTTTIQTPSQRNLNTFGTSTPPEVMSSNGGVSDQNPFWKALLGQMS